MAIHCDCGRASKGLPYGPGQCPICWTILNKTKVGHIQKAVNLGRAVARHIADGMVKRTEEEIDVIFKTYCQPCDLFNGSHCVHPSCGCNVNSKMVFLNKLAWQSERCPIGKW